MPWPLAQLVWERPQAALLLLVPLALLLFARRPGRAPSRATGTLALWREVAESDPSAAKSRRRIPPFLWLVCASLVSGALAIASPRWQNELPTLTWKVLVDRSPSMGLACPEGEAHGDETRLECGLRKASEWLERTAGSGDRVRWNSPGREELSLVVGATPPPSWFALPSSPLAEAPWERHDRSGSLWITDVPAVEPERAALIATGAEPVPGPIAARATAAGDELLMWSETGLETRLVPSRRRIVVPAAGLPPVLERMLTSYGQSRGFERATEVEGAPLAFAFHGADESESSVVEGIVGRDGWTSHVTARVPNGGDSGGEPEAPGSRPWLALPAGDAELTVVRSAPGRVDCYLIDLAEPGGDPAAFAVSWARLFDAALLPAPGVVPLAERRPAGPPRIESGRGDPAPEPGAPTGDDGAALPASWLAFLASLLAALAALLGFSRPRRRP